MSDNGAIPLPAIRARHLSGIEQQARQKRLDALAAKLPRRRLWLYRLLLAFRIGNLRQMYGALYLHKRAVALEKKERALYKALKPEAMIFAKLLKHRLTMLGFSDVELKEGQRRLKKGVRFRAPIYVSPERFYYRVLTTSQRLMGSKSELPWKASATKLIEDDTVRDLEITLNRKVDAVFRAGKGLWYIVHRTEDLSGLPRLVRFDDILQFFTTGEPDICLGVSLHRQIEIARLGKVPHALIAGQTGSGKSVTLNNILCGLIRFNLPAQLKVIIIDLKTVEYFDYFKLDPGGVFLAGQSIPHLVGPVVTEPAAALTTLKQVLALIKLRYKRMAGRARNINEYNRRRDPANRMPRLVLIIDELAELLLDTDSKRGQEAERYLLRIAQLGRAAGVHLICATQRPAKEVVTPNIHANLDLKVSGRMGRQYDSMTVLGTGDAATLENVPGRACYKLGPDVIKVQPPLIERPKILESVGIAMEMPGYSLTLPGAESIIDDDSELIDYQTSLQKMLITAAGNLSQHVLMDTLGLKQGEASKFQARVLGMVFDYDGQRYRVVKHGKSARIVHSTRVYQDSGALKHLAK